MAIKLVEKVCQNEDLSCVYFSLEMTEKQLLKRLQGRNINRDKVLRIEDTSLFTIEEIIKRSYQLAKEKKLSLIIVDYLQLMSVKEDVLPEESNKNILISLKKLAVELNCTVLVLSQLSRIVDTREDKRPQIKDFRNIDCPEDLVDDIWFLY